MSGTITSKPASASGCTLRAQMRFVSGQPCRRSSGKPPTPSRQKAISTSRTRARCTSKSTRGRVRAVAAQQPLDLILARNLISGITLAAFLIDPDGVLVFFNDAAGELIGRRFEEVGRLKQEEWNSEFGPFDEFGQMMPTDSMPL